MRTCEAGRLRKLAAKAPGAMVSPPPSATPNSEA